MSNWTSQTGEGWMRQVEERIRELRYRINNLNLTGGGGGGTGGPPTGPAGGDLTGTYPNPQIANDAVRSVHILDGAVQTVDLADGAVTNIKLGANAVTTDKILDGTILAADLAAGVIPTSLPPSGPAGGGLAGTYPNPTIAANAVGSAQITDGSVTSAEIADGTIATGDLAAATISGLMLDLRDEGTTVRADTGFLNFVGEGVTAAADGTVTIPGGGTGATGSAPTGTVAAYGGTTPPTGWLLCDGTVYNNTSWPALAQLLGTTYGGVAGTSFAVPDLRGRFVLGRGQGTGLTNRVLAATGGAETVTLTGLQSGVQNHGHMRAFNHTASVPGTAGLAGSSGAESWQLGSTASNQVDPGHISAQQAHENMPPFQVLTYIIKAATGSENPLAPDMVGATTVNLNFVGPHGTGTTAPAVNAGTAFTTPAGVLRGTVSMTAFNAASAQIRIRVYVDGVAMTDLLLNPALSTGVHQALSTSTFSVPVTAGTHYIYLQVQTGSSDSGDFGSFLGIITPATGSLAEPATVLNLRLPAAGQALPAATWTTIKGWERQHSYPVWAAETGLGELTVPADGYYRCELTWMIDHAESGVRAAMIVVNGSQVNQQNQPGGPGGGHGAVTSWWEGNLKAGDKVAFNTYSTMAATILGGAGQSGYPATNFLTRAIIRKIYSGGIPGGSGAPDIPWTALPLSNGWVDYGGSYETAGYCRRGGVVYLKGLIRAGTVTSGTVIATLPVGCRSATGITHVIVATGVPSWAFLNLNDSGQVLANAGVNSGWLSLRGISFPADA